MIEEYRKEIDIVDGELIKLFEKRMEIVKSIGEYKKTNGIEIYNKSRENEVLKKISEKLSNKEISKEAEEFFEALMDISKKYQKRIL